MRNSTPRISSANGNGTASACRPSPAARATGDRCGASIPVPARMCRGAFPDLVEALTFEGAIDGELLIVRDGRVQSFNVLQQRLNRKAVTPKLIADFPVHLRVYDILTEGDEDLRDLPFATRRERLEALVAQNRRSAHRALGDGAVLDHGRISAQPVPIRQRVGAGPDADAIEGCMIKRADSRVPARSPQGLLVQVETRSVSGRRRDDVWPARPRQTLVVLFGLHVRGLARRTRRRRTRSGGKSLSRLHGRGTRQARPLCPQPHGQSFRPGARGANTARTRASCSKSLSRGCNARRGTNPGSPCAFPASAASGGTSLRRRRTVSKRLERILQRGEKEIHPLKDVEEGEP